MDNFIKSIILKNLSQEFNKFIINQLAEMNVNIQNLNEITQKNKWYFN